jgi:hypothetical protein
LINVQQKAVRLALHPIQLLTDHVMERAARFAHNDTVPVKLDMLDALLTPTCFATKSARSRRAARVVL